MTYIVPNRKTAIFLRNTCDKYSQLEGPKDYQVGKKKRNDTAEAAALIPLNRGTY